MNHLKPNRMKRLVFTFITVLLAMPLIAQPPARVREAKKQQAQEKQTQTVAVSERAQLEYPTAPTMPENVSWRRDVYRTIDLSQDKNAVLYYPQEPEGDKMNLFTYLFKLVMHKQVTAYDYTIDGKENFSPSNASKPIDILKRHDIRHEAQGERFRIQDSDIPSADVKAYYIKESTYFDQNTASFHSRVTAICPVLKIGEDDIFGGEAVPHPMFWLKYEDIAPYLAKLELMASNYNNAATISADDYFNTKQYEGTIYKTNNLQGRVINNTDSAVVKKEQNRIEKELTQFEQNVWGNDSARIREKEKQDSIAALQKGSKAKVSSKPAKKEDSSTSSRSQVKRQSNGGGSSKSSTPRVSVRRQRH